MSVLQREECHQRFLKFIEKMFKGTIQEGLIELDFDRVYFYLELLDKAGLLGDGKRVVDLGGGLSIFAPLLQSYGSQVIIVDDFGGGG
ncbi:hypothetical protein N8513_01085, partial [bacterium]|nr:hypothetical protein [bacterium]